MTRVRVNRGKLGLQPVPVALVGERCLCCSRWLTDTSRGTDRPPSIWCTSACRSVETHTDTSGRLRTYRNIHRHARTPVVLLRARAGVRSPR